MKLSYKSTIYACYLSYVIQGIVNNISPILFIVYTSQLGLTLDRIGVLIGVNFGVQMLVDLLATRYSDRIGFRPCMITAHVCTALGIAGLGILPLLMTNAFAGLLIATVLSGIGGGLLEVLVSPIVEAAPSGGEKDKAMSMLHSFYCWGCVGFIAISTLALSWLGAERWYVLPLCWAVLPLVNCAAFAAVPINKLVADDDRISLKALFKQKSFRIFVLMMLCAGASEQAMSQWASYFAETGLHVSKAISDLFGPCMFSLAMGSARLLYGRCGTKINLERFITGSCVLCVISYLIAVLSPFAAFGLVGCGLCGFSVGILWPGSFSIAARGCPRGGTAMFALLALAGDIGCAVGPETVGIVSSISGGRLESGLLSAIIFPIGMLALVIAYTHTEKKTGTEKQ